MFDAMQQSASAMLVTKSICRSVDFCINFKKNELMNEKCIIFKNFEDCVFSEFVAQNDFLKVNKHR